MKKQKKRVVFLSEPHLRHSTAFCGGAWIKRASPFMSQCGIVSLRGCACPQQSPEPHQSPGEEEEGGPWGLVATHAAEGGGRAGNSMSHLPRSGFPCDTLRVDGRCQGVTHPGAAPSRQLPASNESLRLQGCQLGAIYRKLFPAQIHGESLRFTGVSEEGGNKARGDHKKVGVTLVVIFHGGGYSGRPSRDEGKSC